jgi:hypothetical protein
MISRALGQINQIYHWRINQINHAYRYNRSGLRNQLNQAQCLCLAYRIRKITLSLAHFQHEHNEL